MRRLFGLAGIGLFTLLVVATVRTATAPSRQIALPAPHDAVGAVDAGAAAERLAEAVRLPTVAPAPGRFADAELDRLHALLDERFPHVRTTLRKEAVGAHGLLLEWTGSDPTLRPVVLMAHQDVVPAPDESRWHQAPFSGAIADGFVWGRGTLDDKGSLLAIHEALEILAAEGRTPRRTVLVASGHDEETLGTDGAGRLAALLAARHVTPEWVLDEGSVIADGILPGVTRPVAFVGLAEKGYVSVDLTVELPGGHSSMPGKETAIGVLARAVDRVATRPMPARFTDLTRGMFEYLGPAMGPLPRFFAANQWFGAPLLRRALAGTPAGEAMIRTTTAPTLLTAGTAENVLAARAQATVNFRILPGDTVESVVRHVVDAVDDRRVAIQARPGAAEPSPVSRLDGPGFAAVQRAVAEVFPDALVSPSLVLAATDSRHFAGLCDCVYRFTPVTLRAADLARLHGVDERIAVDAYADSIRFYVRLLRAAAF